MVCRTDTEKFKMALNILIQFGTTYCHDINQGALLQISTKFCRRIEQDSLHEFSLCVPFKNDTEEVNGLFKILNRGELSHFT